MPRVWGEDHDPRSDFGWPFNRHMRRPLHTALARAVAAGQPPDQLREQLIALAGLVDHVGALSAAGMRVTLEAIQREKQMKEWRRDWKIRRIEENNPDWRDLSHLL